MSNEKLPKYVNPRKLADKEVQLEGTLSVTTMTQFASMLLSADVEVQTKLNFSTDELKIRTITGSAHACVQVECQRCLNPVDVNVEAELSLAIAYSEEGAQKLPGYYDPLIVEEDDVELSPLIEQEMILGLPIVSYHTDCSIQTSFGDGNTVDNLDAEKPNPFSVLASLKGKSEKK